jgi:hypothetical protein
MVNLREIWHSYTPVERRNIAIYIGGIMFYKLGLEFFNGSITTLATDRFKAANTFTKLGAAQGINQAAQCVGAILIAPLIKQWPTRTVLTAAIIFFGLMTMILLIVDAATHGKIKPKASAKPIYGTWNPNAIFIIWTLSGIAYGMVELIRRVIPADILGGHVGKLRRMDATVCPRTARLLRGCRHSRCIRFLVGDQPIREQLQFHVYSDLLRHCRSDLDLHQRSRAC